MEWSSDDEFSLTRPAYRGGYRYVLRARLLAQPNGTFIEATTGVQPRVLRKFFVGWLAVWAFTFFALAPFRGHLGAVIGFLPVVVIWLAAAPVGYFATRHSAAGQVTFLLTTLENFLGAQVVGTRGVDAGGGRLA